MLAATNHFAIKGEALRWDRAGVTHEVGKQELTNQPRHQPAPKTRARGCNRLCSVYASALRVPHSPCPGPGLRALSVQ